MKGIFLSLFIYCCTYGHAHNGKITFAYPTKAKTIDARLSDWENEVWIAIAENFGNPLEGDSDLSARFKIGYNLEENALYFVTEITDDQNQDGDYYEFYINGIHSKSANGVASLIFKDEELKLRIHEPHKDPFHARINKEGISYKVRQKGGTRIVEAKITLEGLLSEFKTIGVDHFIVDVDESGEAKTFLNWGIGFNGFWKEYNSGQLGDVVLLPEKPNFRDVSGNIAFENREEQAQRTVRIIHQNLPGFWVEVKLDSLGNFTTKLPEGEYYLSASNELTNPFAGDGYSNQFRVDTNFRYPFRLDSMENTLGKVTLPVFKEPNFLFEEKGIIEAFSESSIAKLDAFVHTQMKYYGVPGASIAVIKNGNIVYDKVYGVRSVLTQEPITKQTQFQAASVTKSVFAFIVNRLVDQGHFDLDTPLHELLPFNNYANDPRYTKITGRMVLNHTTGMPNWAFGGPGGYASEAEGELNFEPGTQFGYSGEAFEYLARVIEKVTGKNIIQLLQDEVIHPLEIPELYFVGNDSLEFAQGHLLSNPTYWGDYASVSGVAHSMLTNASNFAHFVVALADKEGMSGAQYKAMFNKAVLSPDFPTSPEFNYWDLGIGLGFFVQETVVGKAVMHGGSNYDFQSEFVLYPESKNGFVIFTNSNTGHKLGQALGKFLFYGGTKKGKPKP